MKIAQIHWAFPPIIGGVETHLAIMGPELIKHNCQVSLLTGAVEGLPEEDVYEGMDIYRSPYMDLNSLNPDKIAREAGEIKKTLERFLDRTEPDLIHVHNMHYFSPVHADILYELKLKRGIPMVLTSHNVWADDDELWQEMNRRTHYWDVSIAVSHYIRKEMIRVGYDADKVITIHHGIDLKRFGPATPEDEKEIRLRYPEFEGRPVIFHPARMSLDKGCHISVKALAAIRKEFPDILLVLAGTGKTVDWGSHQQKHVAHILGLVEELGLKDNVYVKFFPWQEMPLVYKAVDFCIYPSCFEEPFGLTMLESMATRKPIIVSRAGGMPEIIKDGVNGYIVPMYDAEALADRCCRLLREPLMCRSMGDHGRSMVQELWTKEVMTKDTLKVYKDICQRKNKEEIDDEMLA